jgi:hypothetical protein
MKRGYIPPPVGKKPLPPIPFPQKDFVEVAARLALEARVAELEIKFRELEEWKEKTEESIKTIFSRSWRSVGDE